MRGTPLLQDTHSAEVTMHPEMDVTPLLELGLRTAWRAPPGDPLDKRKCTTSRNSPACVVGLVEIYSGCMPGTPWSPDQSLA